MEDARRRELVLGAFMLVAGIGYLLMTYQLPRKQFIDAAFVPYILGLSMCLLGVLQLRAAHALKRHPSPDAPAERVDTATVWKTVALIVAYVALLKPIGFPVMTVLYLFCQFIVLTPNRIKPSYPGYAVIAVVASAVIFLLFRYGLDLLLPLGLLD